MTLPSCNKDLYKDGVLVFVTHTLRAKDIETFIVKVRNDCNKPVDWHYAGGRAQVLCFKGDVNDVRKSLLKFRDLHDTMYKKALEGFGGLPNLAAQVNALWNGLEGFEE